MVAVGAFLLRQAQQTLSAEMTKRGLTIAENLQLGGWHSRSTAQRTIAEMPSPIAAASH